jgi:hypothetical protein
MSAEAAESLRAIAVTLAAVIHRIAIGGTRSPAAVSDVAETVL